MPPQEQQVPQMNSQQSPMSTVRVGTWTILSIFVLAVLFLGAWYYIKAFPPLEEGVIDFSAAPVTDISSRLTPEYAAVLASNRSGDYEQASAQYNAIAGNPAATADEKAAALFVGLGSRYRSSGNVDDYLADIRDLKAAVTDPGVQQRFQIAALDSLGSSYCRSGRDERVFEEIYNSAPFNKYLAPGDPNLSSRRLYEWSYSIYPTPKSAVRIARWYVEEPLWDASLDSETKQEYISQALKYSADSDTLIKRDVQRYGTVYFDSSFYTVYWYWRAVNQGGLAQLGVGDYKSTYRQAYEDLFALINGQNNAANKQYLPYAYLFLADTLVKVDGNNAEAKQWLQKAIDFTLADEGVSEFGIFVKNESSKPAWDYSSKAIHDMMDVSPEFKEFAAELSAS